MENWPTGRNHVHAVHIALRLGATCMDHQNPAIMIQELVTTPYGASDASAQSMTGISPCRVILRQAS